MVSLSPARKSGVWPSSFEMLGSQLASTRRQRTISLWPSLHASRRLSECEVGERMK